MKYIKIILLIITLVKNTLNYRPPLHSSSQIYLKSVKFHYRSVDLEFLSSAFIPNGLKKKCLLPKLLRAKPMCTIPYETDANDTVKLKIVNIYNNTYNAIYSNLLTFEVEDNGTTKLQKDNTYFYSGAGNQLTLFIHIDNNLLLTEDKLAERLILVQNISYMMEPHVTTYSNLLWSPNDTYELTLTSTVLALSKQVYNNDQTLDCTLRTNVDKYAICISFSLMNRFFIQAWLSDYEALVAVQIMNISMNLFMRLNRLYVVAKRNSITSGRAKLFENLPIKEFGYKDLIGVSKGIFNRVIIMNKGIMYELSKQGSIQNEVWVKLCKQHNLEQKFICVLYYNTFSYVYTQKVTFEEDPRLNSYSISAESGNIFEGRPITFVFKPDNIDRVSYISKLFDLYLIIKNNEPTSQFIIGLKFTYDETGLSLQISGTEVQIQGIQGIKLSEKEKIELKYNSISNGRYSLSTVNENVERFELTKQDDGYSMKLLIIVGKKIITLNGNGNLIIGKSELELIQRFLGNRRLWLLENKSLD
jgi:hypothetical protein